MTFRIRYHISFLPLFAGLAIAAVALDYAFERGEIAWGLREEAPARALTLAAFVGPFETATITAPLLAQLAARLRRSTGDMSVHWYERTAAGWRDDALLDSASLGAPGVPNAEVVARLEHASSATLLRSRSGTNLAEAVAYAAIADATGRLRAIVGVTIPDVVTRRELRRMGRADAGFAVVALLSGIVVAEFLTWRIHRDVGALTIDAAALAEGAGVPTSKAQVVRELGDLSTTLTAIDRILRENARVTRRRFLHPWQQPPPREIANAYADLAPPPTAQTGGPHFAVRRVGSDTHDDFWQLHRDTQGWHLVVCRLRQPDGVHSELEHAVRADAAAAYYGGSLNSVGCERAWRELHAVFPLVRGTSRTFTLSHETTRIDFAGSDLRIVTEPRTERAELAILGTLEPESLHFACDYVRAANPAEIQRIADELAILLGARDHGLLVVALPSTFSS